MCPCGLPCQGWAWLPASMASPCTPGPRFNFHGVPRDSAVGEAGWSPGPDVELQEAAVAVVTAELSGCRAAWLRGRRLQGQEQPTSRHLGWGTTAQHLPVSTWTRSTAVRSSLLSARGAGGYRVPKGPWRVRWVFHAGWPGLAVLPGRPPSHWCEVPEAQALCWGRFVPVGRQHEHGPPQSGRPPAASPRPGRPPPSTSVQQRGRLHQLHGLG